MQYTRKIRVLLAKPGLDGHDLGIKLIARALRNAGMEVVYTGLNVAPEEVINSAIQESVDVIGISFLSGSHIMLTGKIMSLLQAKDSAHMKVIIGGIIPQKDFEVLQAMGVHGIFSPGTPLEKITDTINELALKKNIR
jgi:methylmalonyl-CoA mutase C-terminal domain/subunit